jgi:hypothetical protein
VALVAGFRAAARPPLADSRAARGALIVASGLAVAFAGYDAYGTYAPTGYRVATVTATILGVVGVLVVGGIALPGPAGATVSAGPAMRAPGRAEPSETTSTPHPADRRSPEAAEAAEAAEPAGSSGRPQAAEPTTSSGGPQAQSGSAAVVDGAPPSDVNEPAARTAPVAVAAGGASLRARLETISLAVGVAIGLITILKEIVAAMRALLG